jgi:hypothetical protein
MLHPFGAFLDLTFPFCRCYSILGDFLSSLFDEVMLNNILCKEDKNEKGDDVLWAKANWEEGGLLSQKRNNIY